MNRAKILVVEDDVQISKGLKLNLTLSGFETTAVPTLNEAWSRLNETHFDLMLLDVGLPDGSGIQLCERVRESGNAIPILFLSARTDEATVVMGLKHGGDDYLRKPFGMEELKVRMGRLFRKTPEMKTIVLGNLKIDTLKRVVTIMDNVVTLGRKEMDILMLLAKRAGEVVSRETILTAIYDHAETYDRTIDSHMSHLRKKLREAAGTSLQIQSVYGLGYKLEWK